MSGNTCIYSSIYTFKYVYISTYVNKYLHIYLYIHIYVYIYLHTFYKHSLSFTFVLFTIKLLHKCFEFLCSLLMPYLLGLCLLRRTCRQTRLYETLFHTVIILSKHHHHHHIRWLAPCKENGGFRYVYVYVYECKYICICMYKYICKYQCTYKQMYTHEFMRKCIYIYRLFFRVYIIYIWM
jgi:hypothetical protein